MLPFSISVTEYSLRSRKMLGLGP
ncbi:hypothetical protein NGA_0271902 [Nannochloropsis gaditana CCMP526]|nr:hypothetical protein NGA_0271902 [Nannochloropsis gaditana CCMP526]EKU22840.1 hypothetical protein NGA_0271902 [Nannochloropsis gaditana CCMP526]|eukprot:XP_005853523.1 hypothetical protein NGA_0271902 [Nannochloropsis gaditana CCMP526]